MNDIEMNHAAMDESPDKENAENLTKPQQLSVQFLKPDSNIPDGYHSDASSIQGEVLPLFEEDAQKRPNVRHMFRSMSVYNPTIPGASVAEKEQRQVVATAKMGTFMGVYLPCLQNIFGVLLFIRLAWIVGTAGVVQAFFVVFICCSVTFLTSISLSAIATNGIVPGGGPYYMISRNLGPELGGAVGILFYLGTSVAASMYIIGAVEIFMLYLYPESKIFEDNFMCFRLYGTILLIILGLIVMAGVRVVNKFALPTVGIVVCCIVLMFVGVFVKFNGSDRLKFCMVGDRLVNMKSWVDDGNQPTACNYTSLQQMFCELNPVTGAYEKCDSYFEEQNRNGKIGNHRGIKGVASGVFVDNIGPKYMYANQLLTRDVGNASVDSDDLHRGDGDDVHSRYAFADITTSFMILIGVFFPSVTGIMAGSNRSGDLADASKSIPRGTIGATLTTSTVYLLSVLALGAATNEMFIRDKFGESGFGRLVVAELAEPHPIVILIGCFLSTVGAGMQSLTGAPRLFQAIAKDGVIPILSPFQVSTRAGEPLRAILLTLCICEVGILIAQLESITALITQFFLMCYCSVNAACALQSLLKSPGWRPRFRYYHWSLSFLGAILCIAVMFISHWVFALVAISIGAVVYKYVEYQGAEKEWGDGLRGLGLSAARYALLNLEDRPPHTRNWRPQLLVICGQDPEQDLENHEHIMSLVTQLKAGRGLTVLASVIHGDFVECAEQAQHVRDFLKLSIKKHRIKGFCDVCITRDRTEGISSVIQTSGLGALRHNTVITTWPSEWRSDDRSAWQQVHEFVDTIRVSSAAECAILLPKHIKNFPLSSQRMGGTLDVWWVVHDGGMLMLLPFLLQKHRTWMRTKLRIFTVAQLEDNSIKMKEDLRTFLYHLRIEAEVDVIEMPDSDISEYTYERTLKMEQRVQLMQNLHMDKRQASLDPQMVVFDVQTQERKLSKIGEELDFNPVVTPDTELSAIPEEDRKASTEQSQETNIDEDNDDTSPREELTDDNAQLSVGKNGDDNKKPKSYPPASRSSTAKSYNIRRMHTAMKLNETIKKHSSEAELIIANLPGPPRSRNEQYYMEFIEVLTEGLDRVLLVKGTGTEVVTIYS